MIIKIHGLKAEAIIGIHIHERKTKQPVFINLTVELNQRPHSDELSTTLDYESLSNQITAYVEQSSYNLLESLVDDILDMMMQHRIVKRATVEIEKPQALKDARNVSLISSRSRTASAEPPMDQTASPEKR